MYQLKDHNIFYYIFNFFKKMTTVWTTVSVLVIRVAQNTPTFIKYLCLF